jgi:molybdopterin synthase catalytic subunit
MIVRVRLFAMLRERAGREFVDVELADGATVADAIAALARSNGGLAEPVSRMPVVMAVNREYASRDTLLDPGDELALIPPVSGGSSAAGRSPSSHDVPAGPHVRVTDQPLVIESVVDQVRDPAAGAIVAFEGMTREVERLEYEAYGEMAEERMRSILAEVIERHGAVRAAAEHRVGSVPISEPTVIVAVSAPHRGEAFEAARSAIDRIKSDTPIWKKEIEAGEEGRWVKGSEPTESSS